MINAIIGIGALIVFGLATNWMGAVSLFVVLWTNNVDLHIGR